MEMLQQEQKSPYLPSVCCMWKIPIFHCQLHLGIINIIASTFLQLTKALSKLNFYNERTHEGN